jgi:hypothetical protein
MKMIYRRGRRNMVQEIDADPLACFWGEIKCPLVRLSCQCANTRRDPTVSRRKGHVLMVRALVHGSSLGESSLCFSQSSRSLVSRSDWETRSKANAPVKRSS